MLWIIYKKYHLVRAVYSPRLMSGAATNEGIENEVYYSEFFSIVCSDGTEELYYQDKKIDKLPDVAFIRCYNFELMRFLTSKGVKLVNSYDGMRKVKDKFITHTIAAQLKIKQPKVIQGEVDFDFLKNELSLPFVMKDNFGAAGRNVHLIYNKNQMEEVISADKKVKYIYQEYIAASKGKDVRLYIVGDEVVGCVSRVATSDDFRSNISLGGISKNYTCSDEIKCKAVCLAKTLGLKICSVDFLINDDELLFCEANGNAAFFAFYSLGYNMQKIFMEYIKEEYFLKKVDKN